MFKKISKIFLSLIVVAALAGVFNIAQAAGLNLNGRILLQVEDKGQAWYVNPLNSERYYLGRPADALNLMRNLGLGVTNTDLSKFLVQGAPSRLGGRILLKVQDKGQAYYINPLTLKLLSLGDPATAFQVIRQQGLGITDANLAKIPIAPGADVPATLSASNFNFKYQTTAYNVSLNLSSTLYNTYKNSPKVYTYSTSNPPANPRDAFYGLFLKARSGDLTLNNLAASLRATALSNNWTSDELAEFTLSFIQYIPYDFGKLSLNSDRNLDPYYPYETLYLDRGVCSDKTFLAVALLRDLGYGAAILDFPDINHSAVGLQCPVADSLNGSGYCYAETTNYFPLGIIPQSINGQAKATTNDFDNLFNSAVLGKVEIYQKTTGVSYTGLSAVKAKIANLKQQQTDLSTNQAIIDNLETSINAQATAVSDLKKQLDAYYASGNYAQYNSLVPTYNNAVNQYNDAYANYQTKVNSYNQAVVTFNQAVKDFYQQ